MIDAIVIGGGPAGLQAALTLGRMHREVVLLDSGEYRNATVLHAQNLVTHDGRAPEELRRLARADLAEYATARIVPATVHAVEARDGGGFAAMTEDGVFAASVLILATGLRDALPPIPGLAEAWGREVAHCPFCHGHELSGRRIGILATGAHAAMHRAMLAPIGSEVVVIDPAEATGVERVAGGLRVHQRDGRDVAVDGLFVQPASTQRAPFAAQLGLSTLPSGGVEIDPMGRTSVPGVFAAGDMAHTAAMPGPMASLAVAIAAGQLAAAAAVHQLVARELDAERGTVS
ncbi:NAD(P)/FAD-dependent oxidoreductase [Microbacterium invictum]|uniref:NAD(P)/FAD-dependent oxidoreductase n=1 Tax=Microbacterium invictum TaxID=515415 RepID=A0ABZ0V9H0_9MICO|nr:NAD(P)/FAD-dependent oxidoreductase [Microbacterium invictum]WQB70270.1 NAD(P)/FAD-dependent oxidoreductase [Microbacterium invictum]